MSNPKCVCVFSNFFPPVVSGSSVQVDGLCRELVKHGWNVVVITANVVKGSADYEVVDGVHIHRLPAFRLPQMAMGFNFPWLSITLTPGNIKRIRAIIEKYDPQVLHLHNYMFDLALSAAYMRRRLKIPLVVTIHTYLRHPSPLINMVFYGIEQLFLKSFVMRAADCVICPDMNVIGYTRREFGALCTALVPYGIQLLSSRDGAQSDLRKRFGLEGKRLILSVGHLHSMRNRKDLILSMPNILQDFPNAVLLIVGSVSTQLPGNLVKKHNIQNSVIFAGALQHSEVTTLLEMADLEAHWLDQDKPSRTSLGIASLEAMSVGVTVLAAANPDTYGNGVLTNGENIMIVEPGEPEELAKVIVDLLGDDERRVAIGACARQTVLDHFSWDSVCEQTVEVYNSVSEKK